VAAAQETAASHGLTAFVSCQDEYSLLARDIEQDLIPTMRVRGLALLPYFPLAGGFLTGKYRRGKPAPKGARLAESPSHAEQFISNRNWAIVEGLERFTSGRGHPMIELAFSWLLATPEVASVIAGASTPEQVEQNVRAGGWILSPADLADIDRITTR